MPESSPVHSPRWSLLGALLLLALSLPAQAETYRMDLIVFLDRYASGEAGRPPQLPNLAGAVLPENAATLQAAGVTVLPDSAFGLQAEWQKLRNSKRFQPIARLAWTQKDPPETKGPALRVRWGEGDPAPVDGRVMLLIVNRYLTLDAELSYSAGGSSWTLDTRRRMRRDELHHLDSAKLGIVARVTKADDST
ncbi:CsiV family protein [Solimonas soli]|uniref:CsiV family protein n=1 Tax=Solimonas soli TaxID=413479 RepID=UPI000481644E|nr:CsiV family protein [Solimonas soli]